MSRWSKKELQEIFSVPFEIFPERTAEMIKKGIPRGPLPWHRLVFLHQASYNKKATDPRMHLHHTTYDLAFAGTGSGKSALGAALMLWWMITFPGCYVVGGANRYSDFESNVIEKYLRPLLSIKNLWDHPWVTCVPNEHNKQLDLTIEVSPGVYKTSTAFFMHFSDWARLKGKEVSFIFFDEMSQCEDPEPFEELTRRLRSPYTPFHQFYATTNPPTSMSHWIYDRWDFSQYIDGWEGDKPKPKLCDCNFCQECLNNGLGEFPYTDDGWCTNPNCAQIETFRKINEGLPASQQVPLKPAHRVVGALPKDSYPDYEPYYCPGGQNMWRLFMGNSMDNYAIQASVMQNLKQSQDKANFDLHVLGKPSSLGSNKAYYNYSMSNIIDDINVDPEKDIHWSFDFNVIPQCSVICQLVTREIDGVEEICPVVVDEIAKYQHWDGKNWKRGAGPEHVAQDFIKRYTEWNEKGNRKRWVLLHGDHTTLNIKQSPSEASSFQIVVNMLQEAGFNVLCTVKKVKGVQVLERRRVNAVNWLLKDPKGNSRLQITRGCKHLRKSLEDMEIDKSTNSLKKKSIDDAVAASTNLDKIHLQSHISDALGYFIVRKWDLVGTDENPLSYVYVPGYKLIDVDTDDISAANLPEKQSDEPISIRDVHPEPGSLLEYIKGIEEEQEDFGLFGQW